MAIDLATLGLTVKNDAAVAAIDATGRKLDEMGQKGDAAASKVSTAGQRVEASMQRQAKVVRDLSGEYDRLTKDDLSAAVAKFDAMYGPATKAADATTKVAKATKELAEVSGETATAGVGRLRQSFASLAAQVSGTSPIMDRIVSTLGSFAVGDAVVIGALLGIAAIGAAWHAMTNKMADDAKTAEDALARLRDQIARTKDAMGSVSLAAAQANLAAAKDALANAQQRAGGRDQTPGSFGAMISASDVDDAKKTVAEAQAVVDQALRNQSHARAEGLADLIRSNQLNAAERARAIAQLKADQAEAAKLVGKTDDVSMDRRIALAHDISSLKDALYPKKDAAAATSLANNRFRDLNDQIDHTMASVLATIKTSDKTTGFVSEGPDLLDAKAIAKGAGADLSKGGVPMFQSALDRVTILQAQLDVQNAGRAANGKKAVAPSKDLLEARKAADDYGSAIIDAIARSNASWQTQAKLIDEIIKKLKEAGALVPKPDSGPSRASQIAGDASSTLRTAADTVNLFGSNTRAQQYGNILNTGANAIDDITSGHFAQAGLAILSLGKQIVGLGSQSHDAARQVAEASEAVKNMLAQLQASVSHDALGSLLAQAQAADDARKKQINDDLSGKKKENERNKALAQDAQLYAQQVQQIQQQYTVQQGFDLQSLQARLLAAKGLTYQAQQAELAVKQQEEYNKAVLDGRDATYLATLAQVQLAEKTQLANDAITQLANSPTGFFAERYFGDYAIPTVAPTSPSTNGSNGSGDTNFNAPITIRVDGSGDPQKTATAVVHAIRQMRDQTLGNGGSMADAMELM